MTTGVISGPLTMTAPATAALGDGAPGATIESSLGTVQVTDGRGFGADWSASVSSSSFTTGVGGPAETIPVSDALYDISGLTTATGPATFGFVPQNRPVAELARRGQRHQRGRQHRRHLGSRDPGDGAGRGRRPVYSGTIVHSVS